VDGFDSEAENKATTRQGCGQDAGRNAEMAQKDLKKPKINKEVGLMTDLGLTKKDTLHWLPLSKKQTPPTPKVDGFDNSL